MGDVAKELSNFQPQIMKVQIFKHITILHKIKCFLWQEWIYSQEKCGEENYSLGAESNKPVCLEANFREFGDLTHCCIRG